MVGIDTQNARPPDLALPPLPPALASVSGQPSPPSPLLSAFRYVAPTPRDYIRYVDAEARTGNLDAHRYLDNWMRIGERARRAHMPEQLCDLSGVAPADLVAWVSKQAFLEGAAQANMLLTFRRGPVLEAVADFAAASADNYRHAELFMKSAGMLPAAARRGGGSSISIFNAPIASSGSVAGVKSDSAPVERTGLREMDADVVELARIMQTGGTDCRAEQEPELPADNDEEEDEPED